MTGAVTKKEEEMKIGRVISRVLGVKDNSVCPQCGRRMIRIRRKNKDRLLSLFVPVIRCGCCGKSYLISTNRNEVQVNVPQKN